MAKCPRCNKRKAKRHCMALDQAICNLCCGLLREKEIHCPADCGFLTQHRTYQEKRITEKKPGPVSWAFRPEEDILQDERLAWLALHAEIPIREAVNKNPSFSDKDALLALEYAKEKMMKDRRIILLSEQKPIHRNEVGEAVFQSMQACRFEKQIVLPGELQNYKKEERIKCIERLIYSARALSGENFESRNYIQNLIQRFEKIKEASRTQKIIPGK